MDELLQLFDLKSRDLIAIPVAIVWFLFFYRGMKNLVFQPYLRLVEKREAATVGAVSEAHAVEAEAEALRTQIEDELRHSREKFLHERAVQLEATRRESEALEQAALLQAHAVESEERKKLAEEKVRLESSLAGESQALAQAVQSRIVEIAGN